MFAIRGLHSFCIWLDRFSCVIASLLLCTKPAIEINSIFIQYSGVIRYGYQTPLRCRDFPSQDLEPEHGPFPGSIWSHILQKGSFPNVKGLVNLQKNFF